MKIIWTKHAEDRQREWEKKLGTRQKVEDLVHSPEQIVPGDMDVLVAQVRTQSGLLRAPFVAVGGDRKNLYKGFSSYTEKNINQGSGTACPPPFFY